ncbi:MAG: glutamate--cysteine ligase [Gammaproteobacteria bacterium]|nr:glutamate--cysteine ligase [Gammaproteobacteria bacterium]
MGQEINTASFTQADFDAFYECLENETSELEQLISTNNCSQHSPVAGFEIEAWLLDQAMNPTPRNQEFLEAFQNPLATTELARFNIELNNQPVALNHNALSQLHQGLNTTWQAALKTAHSMNTHLLMIGTLPTLKQSDLNLTNMSPLKRYQALNEQILHLRGEPLKLSISGQENLSLQHDDVMLESATTSFQIHLQTPLTVAHHYYNAAVMASAPMVGICANSPYLFGKDLWCETRIPLFEQAIEVGGYDGASHGPIRRVSFGTQYARNSIMEFFMINLNHFPILLPMHFDQHDNHFAHLRLHNGTIWRWNRPLVGFDEDGTAHIRIEHRVVPAGPTIIDSIANAAFFYGLAKQLCDTVVQPKPQLTFSQAKDNFYQSARYGLDAQIHWLDGTKHHLQQLIDSQLIDMAYAGLSKLGIDPDDATTYLEIIRHRNQSGQTGSQWQRQFMHNNPGQFNAMTAAYLDLQSIGQPVHTWDCT